MWLVVDTIIGVYTDQMAANSVVVNATPAKRRSLAWGVLAQPRLRCWRGIKLDVQGFELRTHRLRRRVGAPCLDVLGGLRSAL